MVEWCIHTIQFKKMLFYKLFYYFEVWEYYNLAPINVYLATIHILNFSQTGIISTANNIYPTLWLLMSMSEILRDYFQRRMNTQEERVRTHDSK